LEIAQSMTPSNPDVSEAKQREVRNLYKDILNTEDLSKFEVNELLEVLQHDSLLERFAYRKQNGMASRR